MDELAERKNTTSEDDNIEQRSINDTTTIASRDDDDDSDQDELSMLNTLTFRFQIKKEITNLTDNKDNSDEILVKPEFEGLWNKQLKAYNAQDLYKTNFKFPTTVKTTAEKVSFFKKF